ncbi:ribonuclease HII [Congregibacter litoralis]|uniref:Ribonuclease HII n=1 Tax=Congregibacter litoralis KT71 TaxID=314285 RepID=A4ACY9_9GAMM|nr:ribonuclease HII [Congregibacter litoralis]EAQ96180.1 RNase HII [Congregibacter litoralis KT71]
MALSDWEAAIAELPDDACIVGVDEVGRGPLAGDVVAAAAVLDPANPIVGLTDSKKLTAKRREVLREELLTRARGIALGRASPVEIDTLNILQASLLAMWRAVDALGLEPDLVLVDGRQLPSWDYASIAVVKGDARVPAIAAASIVAKVARDQYMCEQHALWPHYGFDRHKGYPTAAHMAALKTYGVSPLHRRSFAPVRAVIEGD